VITTIPIETPGYIQDLIIPASTRLRSSPEGPCVCRSRNHGFSGHSEAMSYQEMAADVFALMEQQGIDRAVVLGHSMGGKVAAGALSLEPCDFVCRSKSYGGNLMMIVAPCGSGRPSDTALVCSTNSCRVRVMISPSLLNTAFVCSTK
jgi:hypothetical protein